MNMWNGEYFPAAVSICVVLTQSHRCRFELSKAVLFYQEHCIGILSLWLQMVIIEYKGIYNHPFPLVLLVSAKIVYPAPCRSNLNICRLLSTSFYRIYYGINRRMRNEEYDQTSMIACMIQHLLEWFDSIAKRSKAAELVLQIEIANRECLSRLDWQQDECLMCDWCFSAWHFSMSTGDC